MKIISLIRDDKAHRAALTEISRLWKAKPGTPAGERLDLLMTLVDDYERKRWPVEDLNPIDAIKARMVNSGRNRKDFEAIIGSSGRASEILNRKRHLTLAMIWKLVHEWQMPAEVLIRPYDLARTQRRSPRAKSRKVKHKSRRSSAAAAEQSGVANAAVYLRERGVGGDPKRLLQLPKAAPDRDPALGDEPPSQRPRVRRAQGGTLKPRRGR
jgi:HTH-type transcriptional regulator/antitoxin HigA